MKRIKKTGYGGKTASVVSNIKKRKAGGKTATLVRSLTRTYNKSQRKQGSKSRTTYKETEDLIKRTKEKAKKLNKNLRETREDSPKDKNRSLKVFEKNLAKFYGTKKERKKNVTISKNFTIEDFRALEALIDTGLKNDYLSREGRVKLKNNLIVGLVNDKKNNIKDEETALSVYDWFREDIIQKTLDDGLLNSEQLMDLLDVYDYNLPTLTNVLNVTYDAYKSELVETEDFWDAIVSGIFMK